MTAVSSLRVLAVDDNSSLLRFLVSAFTASGCAVTAAPTAEEALDRIETDAFDPVVSAIKMPGLGGLDLLRGGKATTPEAPVGVAPGGPTGHPPAVGRDPGSNAHRP